MDQLPKKTLSLLICIISLNINHPTDARFFASFKEDRIVREDKGLPSKAIKNPKYLWPNGDIPYKFDSSVENVTGVIGKAIQHWMEHVCLNFHEKKGELDRPFIIFQKKTGCNSVVGMQWFNRNGQVVSIGKDCDAKGTIAHEIGHALGFYHEHSRADRDEHVKILSENIQENHLSSFTKRSYADTERYDIPYDVASIMHYGPKMFSKNNGNTIVSLDPMKHFLLGQRSALSFFDKKLANLMYNCSEKCDSPPTCQNDGYVDMTCVCRCPDGFDGKNCENILPLKEPQCGGIVAEPSNIFSPNYPQKYPRRVQCVWWVKAPNGTTIKATFNDFELINPLKNNKCMMDEFEIRTKDIYNGERFCGQQLNSRQFESDSNNMVFLFTGGKLLTKKGFNITIEFIGKNNSLKKTPFFPFRFL